MAPSRSPSLEPLVFRSRCVEVLRHFLATEILEKAVQLEIVGRILGHSGIGITADIYRHVRTGELHEEAKQFAPLNGVKTLPEGRA